jgi:hypothetical protein
MDSLCLCVGSRQNAENLCVGSQRVFGKLFADRKRDLHHVGKGKFGLPVFPEADNCAAFADLPPELNLRKTSPLSEFGSFRQRVPPAQYFRAVSYLLLGS